MGKTLFEYDVPDVEVIIKGNELNNVESPNAAQFITDKPSPNAAQFITDEPKVSPNAALFLDHESMHIKPTAMDVSPNAAQFIGHEEPQEPLNYESLRMSPIEFISEYLAPKYEISETDVNIFKTIVNMNLGFNLINNEQDIDAEYTRNNR